MLLYHWMNVVLDARRRQGKPQSACTRDFVQMLEESDAYVEELDEDMEFYKIRSNKPKLPSFLKNMEDEKSEERGKEEEFLIPSTNPAHVTR